MTDTLPWQARYSLTPFTRFDLFIKLNLKWPSACSETLLLTQAIFKDYI